MDFSITHRHVLVGGDPKASPGIPLFDEPIGKKAAHNHTKSKKPDPDGIFFLADKLGLDPGKEMLMVGDHTTDIEVGRRAGCRTVFIEGGIGRKRGLTPDLVIRSITELPHLIENL